MIKKLYPDQIHCRGLLFTAVLSVMFLGALPAWSAAPGDSTGIQPLRTPSAGEITAKAGRMMAVPTVQVGSITVNPSAVSIKKSSGFNQGTQGSAQGTVILAGPAASSGTVVNLSCPNPGVVFPAYLNFPAGATTLTFSLTVKPDAQPGDAVISAISSGAGGVAKQAVLSIRYEVHLLSVASNSSLTVDPACDLCRGDIGQSKFVPLARPGYVCGGVVKLDGNAPMGGLKVSLSNTSGSIQLAPSVIIPAGTNSANFRFTVSPTATSGEVVIKAALDGSGDAPVQTVIPIFPFQSLVLGVNPPIVDPGGSATGSINIEGPSPKFSPLSVALSSSNPSVTVPASVIVPGGQSSATFTVAVKSTAASESTASINGSMGTIAAKQPVNLSIKATQVNSVFIPNPLVVGFQTVGSVSLTTVAASAVTVNLSCSSPGVTIPASVTIAAGQNSAPVTITTSQTAPIGSTVTITAVRTVTGGVAVKGTSIVAGLTQVASVAMPYSMLGGSPYTGTVKLQRAAEPGGAVINLRQDTGATASPVTLPLSITIPAGQISANFSMKVSGNMNCVTRQNLQIKIGALRAGQDPKNEVWSTPVPVTYCNN
jgi:hypothetical protein